VEDLREFDYGRSGPRPLDARKSDPATCVGQAFRLVSSMQAVDRGLLCKEVRNGARFAAKLRNESKGISLRKGERQYECG
jgi:hypothetical protein